MSTPLIQAGLAPRQMLSRLDSFIEKIAAFSSYIKFDFLPYQMDHIALRINDVQLAQSAREAWAEYGQEISAAQINGRPIVVFEFLQPIQTKEWRIECLELPFPAQGKVYPTQDWEHVEFVVPSDAQTAEDYLNDLFKRFPEFATCWPELEAKGIKTKLSSPKGEGERLANPTVAFKWQGVTIKLHPHSLKRVIESES